jgi:DNA-binding CsgD family transcriptional regulator
MKNIVETVQLLERQTELVGAKSVLLGAVAQCGLSHAAYVSVNMPYQKRTSRRIVVSSYPQKWQSHYLKNGYDRIDPVLRACATGVLPVEWSRVKNNDEESRDFFGEAETFGVGRFGLTIPIRGPHDEFALFSVAANTSEREWDAIRHHHVPSLLLLSFHFHEWIRLSKTHGTIAVPTLSRREAECLRWISEGKSLWEISTILGVSERTIRFHLDNVRIKLDAVNTMQAAAKAISLGLLPRS